MSNIIDFIARKNLKEKGNSSFIKQKKDISTSISSFPYLENAAEHNRANIERLRKEREQANKNVIKNYKIK